MKLARVRVEYTCGLTFGDKVALNVETGAVCLPPRLRELMTEMEKTECTPAFTLEYNGFQLPVRCLSGDYSVNLPQRNGPVVRQMWESIKFPTKEQRQQNGRYIHTLSAASIGGAAAAWHSAVGQGWHAAMLPGFLSIAGVLLWYAGFLSMKGE